MKRNWALFFCLFCIGFSNKSSGNEDIDVYFALLGNDFYDYFVLFFLHEHTVQELPQLLKISSLSFLFYSPSLQEQKEMKYIYF